MNASLRTRLAVFVAILAVAIAGSIFVVLRAVAQDPVANRPSAAQRASESKAVPLPTGPRLVFRSTAPDTYGLVAVAPLDAPDAPAATTSTECERIYATPTSGLCLSADRGVVTTYQAQLLGPDLKPARDVELAGIPSRARVSPDGKLAAATTFVSGHSYSPGKFSTATTLYGVATGKALGNLETWKILKDGRPYKSADTNVWGVSFTPDSKNFYVTVASKGRTWLSRGNVATKTIVVIGDTAECPSVSPDGRHVAFKRTTGRAADWRIWVKDLSTGTVTKLGETNSVDDQVEWLDNDHVIYGLQREGSAEADLWTATLDGATPTLLRKDAWSPAVIRSQ